MADRYEARKRKHPETNQIGWGVWDKEADKWLGSWHKEKGHARHHAKRANRVEDENR